MKHSLFISAMAAALLLTACDKSSENKTSGNANGETEVVVDVTPAVPSKDELISKIITTDLGDRESLMEDAKLYVENYGVADAQIVSNQLWAGNNYEKNRAASGVIAVAAHDKQPEPWSTLRSGIAYVNGLGVDKNASNAVTLLSSPSVSDNPSAHYFLSKAYLANGQEDLAMASLRKAADMGHEVAKKEIQG